ncbi:MAG: hypothetical protein RLZZ67_121 [Candidatus Parcubacteria bacterium]|jgi:sporulation protein YlmC with PRC-barrel domain
MDKALIGIMVVVALFILGGSGILSSPVVQPSSKEETFTIPVPTDFAQSTETPVVPTRPVESAEEGSVRITSGGPNSITVSQDQTTGIFSLGVQAVGSQISIQRIRIDLGATKDVWLRIFKTLYVVDGSGKVLAQSELTKSTVSNMNGRWVATLAGFDFAVKKNETGTLYIKANSYPLIDSNSTETFTLAITEGGVRGQDARGGNIYGPAKTISLQVVHPVE